MTPAVKSMKEIISSATENIQVGILGTSPVSKYSTSTGAMKPRLASMKRALIAPKKAKG